MHEEVKEPVKGQRRDHNILRNPLSPHRYDLSHHSCPHSMPRRSAGFWAITSLFGKAGLGFFLCSFDYSSRSGIEVE